MVNEAEALVIKRIFKMYAFGREGTLSIANKLNEAGLRKRNGKKWGKRLVLGILKNPLYVGKLRWLDAIYEGIHDPIVSDALFEKAQAVLEERNEDVKGRQWKSNDKRLLSGVIRCGRCNSHMAGNGCRKDDAYIPYYACSKRTDAHECDQDYIRADLLEAAVIHDIKSILQNEELLDVIREKVNARYEARQPDVEKELADVEKQAAETKERIERYFAAFETGDMAPGVCNKKVKELRDRLKQLEDGKQALESRQNRRELPALDGQTLQYIVENLERVLAEGTNPQKKAAMRALVPRIIVQTQRRIEVTYCLPERTEFAHWDVWLPGQDSNSPQANLRPAKACLRPGVRRGELTATQQLAPEPLPPLACFQLPLTAHGFLPGRVLLEVDKPPEPRMPLRMKRAVESRIIVLGEAPLQIDRLADIGLPLRICQDVDPERQGVPPPQQTWLPEGNPLRNYRTFRRFLHAVGSW